MIEHNLDVIKTADSIVDFGPQGGVRGGEIVAKGTPEDVVKVKRSFTAKYIVPLLTCSLVSSNSMRGKANEAAG